MLDAPYKNSALATLALAARALAAAVALAVLSTGAMSASAAEARILRLATTTSTENSGLLGYLLPHFEQAHDYEVQVIAVGTGKALRLGAQGDVDMLMVHARRAEERFVEEGHGVERLEFMYNDFVIVGPPGDPAGLRASTSAIDALRAVAGNESRFVSRGDDSGTHKKERALWQQSGTEPAGAWYLESGQGMGKVLQMSSELGAYTLTDRGTWLSHRSRLELALLFENDPPLHNPYSIITVNPQAHPHTNIEGARAFTRWLASHAAQQLIATYKFHGKTLFNPLLLDRAALDPYAAHGAREAAASR